MKKGTQLNKNGNPIRQKMHVRKGDTVQVITGRDKGKIGEVVAIFPKKSTVVIEGVNRRTKHIKPTQEGESGRIETTEFPLHSSNVMLYSKAEKVASRATTVVDENGRKVRKLKKTGEIID
ncbi:MAG: 50S ribosomal protein L24 [Cyanophyceae cyanobacterium]